MAYESDDGASDPLLGGFSDPSTSTNVPYDRDSGMHADGDDIYAPKKRNLGDSYLKQLEYTPLVFKVIQLLYNVTTDPFLYCLERVLRYIFNTDFA